MTRPRALVFSHPLAPEAARLADATHRLLAERGWRAFPETLDDAGAFDIAIVLGGDGTLLRGAERVRGRGIPLLGVNVGHMGFLAEADAEDLDRVLARVCDRDYRVERRATVAGRVIAADGAVKSDWALNEITIEKTSPHRMIEVAVSVDGRPLTAFGCDGIALATPTGSTGHAFSGGGPVIWPEVEALLMVPLSAHALFARPVVVSPSTTIAIDLLAQSRSLAEVTFDGRRVLPLATGERLEVRHSAEPVELVRFGSAPFADRLVSKFSLPVKGWRG
ncbi:MAG: NAD kinase [Bifidobacteriaceae bacterium]|jgi:NAD+ kinase|nr:NAD kinase [Bifidobacteriaceae bacterium]